MPPRNSDTDTGSETEVKSFPGSIDLNTTQESFISSDFNITPSNTDTTYCLSDRNDHGISFEFPKEIATASNLAINTCNQDNLISSGKNDISPNVISPTSKYIISAGDKAHCLMSNNDDNILNQNEFLIPLTNIVVNNYLTEEDRIVQHENFINQNIWLNLSDSDSSIDCESEIFDNDIVNFDLTPIDFTTNTNDFTNVNNTITNSALALSADNLEKDFTQDDQDSLKQIAGIVLKNIIPYSEMDKDSIISESEKKLFVNKLPSEIISLSRSRDSLSSSSSEIYRSTETLHSDSIISNMNNSIKFLECNLPIDVERHKYEDTYVINEGKDFIINKNRNIRLINDSNNAQVSDIIHKENNALTTIPTDTANVYRVCPIVTVTSPSPTQEKQLEELPVQTLRLLSPQNSHTFPGFVDCNSSFDKLKQDLKERKAKNMAIENELKPLSAESARMKISKYFMESKKPVSRSRSTLNKEIEQVPKVEITKLDIKPKLSSKINMDKISKYFNNSSCSNKNGKHKTCNITNTAVKQNTCREVEIDIESISDINEKKADVIDEEFNQIEEHSKISNSMENNQSSQCNLPFEICIDEEDIDDTLIYDNLNLVYNDLIELQPELNIDINYTESQMSIDNILKLDNYDNNIPDLNVELKNDILRLHTAIDSNIPTSHTDERNNNQINVTNEGNDMKKIDHIDTQEDDVKKTNIEKEINVKLNSKTLESVMNEDLITINSQNNISDNFNTYKQTFKNYMILSKSDTKLNKNTTWVHCKDISNKSKSLCELRNMVREIVPAVKVTDIGKIVGASDNIKDTKVISNSSTCIKEVPKGESQKHLSSDINVSPKIYSMEPDISSFYVESTVPKAPVRKKAAKRCVELLNRNQDVENTSKTKNSVQDVTKLCSPANNVSNIKNQDIEKQPNIKNPNVNLQRLRNQNVNNTSENQRLDVSKQQNYDSEDILKQSSQNIKKLQNQHVTNHKNFNNEITKDGKVIIETQNRDVINVSKTQTQNENAQETYHLASRLLPNKLEESVKLTPRNNPSKKDKCIIS